MSDVNGRDAQGNESEGDECGMCSVGYVVKCEMLEAKYITMRWLAHTDRMEDNEMTKKENMTGVSLQIERGIC